MSILGWLPGWGRPFLWRLARWRRFLSRRALFSHRGGGLRFFRLRLGLWSGLGARLADARDGGADLGRDALLDQDLQHAVGVSLEIEGRLVRFDLGQRLAGLRLAAALLLPLDDGALLHRVRELGHVDLRHQANPPFRISDVTGALRSQKFRPFGVRGAEPRLGIGLPSERVADQALDVLTGRDRDPLELLVVRRRHLRTSEPADERAQGHTATLQ